LARRARILCTARGARRDGGNLNQIARWLNTAVRTGRASEVEALRVTAALIGIERRLAEIIAQHRRPPGC